MGALIGWRCVAYPYYITRGKFCKNTKKDLPSGKKGALIGGVMHPVLTLSSMVICGHLEMSRPSAAGVYTDSIKPAKANALSIRNTT